MNFTLFKSVSKSLSLSLHSIHMLEMKLSVCKLDENEKSDRAKLVIHRIISGITQSDVRPRGIYEFLVPSVYGQRRRKFCDSKI